MHPLSLPAPLASSRSSTRQPPRPRPHPSRPLRPPFRKSRPPSRQCRPPSRPLSSHPLSSSPVARRLASCRPASHLLRLELQLPTLSLPSLPFRCSPTSSGSPVLPLRGRPPSAAMATRADSITGSRPSAWPRSRRTSPRSSSRTRSTPPALEPTSPSSLASPRPAATS